MDAGLIEIGLLLVVPTAAIVWLVSRISRVVTGHARGMAEALPPLGVKVRTVEPSRGMYKPARLAVELDGSSARVEFLYEGRQMLRQSVHIDAPPQLAIVIGPRSAIGRLGNKLGVFRSTTIGDEAFDKDAAVRSNVPEDAVRGAFRSPEARAAVLDIVKLGYVAVMSENGLSAFRVRYGTMPRDAPSVPAVIRALRALLAALSSSAAPAVVRAPALAG